MMNSMPDISTRYSLLTRLSEDDMCIFKEILDDARTRRFIPELYELLDAPNGLQEFVTIFEQYAQSGEGYLWGIKNNKELVGFVAVMDLSDTPILFYAMHPNHRSCGYMKDALHSVIEYLCNHIAIRTVSTEVYKENSISATLLQQLGFCVCSEDDDKVYLSKVLAQ